MDHRFFARPTLLTDDREGCLFTVTVHRQELTGVVEGADLSEASGKTEKQLLLSLSERPEMTIPELVEALGLTTRGVEKQLSK